MDEPRNEDPDFQRWARAVKVRDNYTCQVCDVRGVYLESHHKNGWNAFPDERYDLDNGVTLCRRCHDRFHETFGYGGNTKFQFAQYEQVATELRKLAEKNVKGREESKPTISPVDEDDSDI